MAFVQLIECEGYSKKGGEEEKNTYRSVAIFPYAASSSPNNSPPVSMETLYRYGERQNRQSDVVQLEDGCSAVSVWGHHGVLMCSKLQVVVGFLGETGMAGDHAARLGGGGQLENSLSQLTSGCRSYPTEH